MTRIPVMNEKLSFEDAFSAARAVGAPLFDWRDKTYTSQLTTEVERPEIEPKIVRWRDADDEA